VLVKLTIQNYALIQQLELTPGAGLNVITGETGAGTSIMLGALGLLLGNRADTKVLWEETDKCVTEGEFNIAGYRLQSLFKKEDLDYDDVTVIRREISAAGKSRAFINDTPVTLDILKKIGGRLMDIHSQHETLELGTRSFQLALLDAFAGNEKIKSAYEEAWRSFSAAQRAYSALEAEALQLQQEADFVRFQLDELTKAALTSGEQEKLERELTIQEHAEEIKSRFHAIAQALTESDYSARSTLAEVRSQLGAVASFAPRYEELLQRLESLRIELDDIASEAEREEQKVEFDPEHLEEIKNRLSLIYQLQHKHRQPTVEGLLALQEQLQLQADKTFNLDENLKKLSAERDAAERVLAERAAELTRTRTKVLNPLCQRIKVLLQELGIPEAQVKIEHEPVAPGPTGADQVELLFSANKGMPVRPLAQVASGGEFARLMFSIKYVMAEKTAMPTLVLDEIDTGVSGEVALRLGRLMQEMGTRHQVIAISHLPQIAAQGDTHFFVYKDNTQKKTVSHIRKLSEAERVEEIAKMIGGANPSSLARQNARELMTR
jgi:DNA repair protein RecN (Recombination protein N)